MRTGPFLNPDFYRPTWVEVNADALRWNVAQVRACLPPGMPLLAQVKANAYGHGAVDAARTFAACGVESFGVISLEEAFALRDAGITQPILIQTVLSPADVDAVLDADVWPTVCTHDFARVLHRAAFARGQHVTVHLKVDVGMGRLGVWHEEVLPFLEALRDCDTLRWDGCYTHLPSADVDPAGTRQQVRAFTQCVHTLRDRGYPCSLAHASNSMGVLAYAESHSDMARPGLMLYGLYPAMHARTHAALQPALQWKSRIIFLKRTPAGRSISYGGTHTTTQDTLIATIPVGYGDGYRRCLSNRSEVLVRGQRVPVVGRVCMDHLMLDVGNVPEIAVGDEVVLLGTQGTQSITADTLAALADTIVYEIVTGITARVPRIYVDNNVSDVFSHAKKRLDNTTSKGIACS